MRNVVIAVMVLGVLALAGRFVYRRLGSQQD